jgi:RNA recognition motif-containing protein
LKKYETIQFVITDQWHIMKILVRNLARTTTEEELRALFASHGTVNACDLVLDQQTGKSKGFGFIEMPHESEARLAISGLHESQFAKSKIRVKVAK